MVDLARFAPALSGLAPLQQRYVLARMRGFNQRASAKLAGYADPDNAYQTEKNPKVRLVLDAMVKASAAELGVARADVLAGLMDSVRMAADSTELTGAWREIAKVIGAYEPIKVQHAHTVTHTKLQQMSDSELATLADDPNFVIEGEFEAVPAAPEPPPADADPEVVQQDKRYDTEFPAPEHPEGLGSQAVEAILAEQAFIDQEAEEAIPK